MRFAFLIAADTIRSVRRHRVLLAFLLVALAGASLVTTGISRAVHRVQRTEQAKQEGAGSAVEPSGGAALAAKTRQVEEAFNAFFSLATSELGSLLALVLFCTIVSGEVHTGTIRVTLAKPVPRWAYLLGKCFGASAVI